MPAIGRSFGGLAPPRRITAVEFFAERLQALQRLGLQPAVGQFLDPVRQPVFQEAPVIGRRLGLEEIAPLLLEMRRSARLQRRHARQHGVGHSEPPCIAGVGMTALVGGTVERTFSAVGR